MDLVYQLFPWYLVVGSALGVGLCYLIKKQIDNPGEAEGDDRPFRISRMHPQLRLAIEMQPAAALTVIALFITATWLPVLILAIGTAEIEKIKR